MATLLLIIGFALLIVETLVGMGANGFIVLISCIDWFRRRKLAPIDLVLTSLGLSRFIIQATAMLQIMMVSFFLRTYLLSHIHFILNFTWLFTDYINLWFAAWLSVLYFVKITTFSHPIFLQVKQRFSGLLPWLLLGSVAFSALMTITISTVFSGGLLICDPYRFLLNNSYEPEVKMPDSCSQVIFTITSHGFIPLAIFLSSTVSLIISLWMHIRHLRHNGISTEDLSTRVHLTAIKSLASFAILYLSSFIAIYLQSVLTLRSSNTSWTSVFFPFVSGMYPSGHAVILILINPKLKEAWIRMIHHLKCRASEAPS